MSFLFVRIRHVGYIARAIDIWAESDRLIARVVEAGDEVRAEVQAGRRGGARIEALVRELQVLNEQLQPLEDAFSYTLGEASRWARRVLISGFLVLGTVRVAAASVIYAAEIRRTLAAETALRETEARFRTMVDAIPQLAWMARPDGWIYWYNRRWYEYTGTTPEQMEGWGWQRVHDRAMLPAVMERWKCSIATGEPFDMVFPLCGADGKFRSFLTRVSPFKDARGRVIHWFGTNTDITAQREAEQALRLADRRKDEFLATLAHELRNPLAPIRNSVEILRRRGQLTPDLAAARDIIDRQSRHLTRLVDDLLEVSRITGGKLQLRNARIPLAGPLRDAVEAARPVVEARVQELTVDLPREDICVDADATRLTQIVLNLLNNAAKFTPKGGRIWLSADAERGKAGAAGEAVIAVRDTGIGIAPEHLSGLFEIFSQVSPVLERSDGGLGIGLALVRGLTELHGGRVEARSAGLGKGAEFIVRLPLVLGGVESQVCAAARAVQSQRILVVDDNRDTAASLRRLFELWGHEVIEAHDGIEALQAAEVSRPDVVLLDIGMPRMNGYDTASELRKRAKGQALLLIAITGWGQEEDRQRSLAAGFDAHLTKPVEIADLEVLLAARQT